MIIAAAAAACRPSLPSSSLVVPGMAVSNSSTPHLSPARSSCRIAGDRTIPAPRHGPAVRIRSWRRFAAPCSTEVFSLAPARLLRPPPRRRNALREKASHAPPVALHHHQVRSPCHVSSPTLDAQLSSDLDQELAISGGQGASLSGGDVTSDPKSDVIGDAEEVEVPLCRTGAGPAYGVYKDPDCSVMQFEVREDKITNRSEASDNNGSGGFEAMPSRARVMAVKLLGSSDCVTPDNSDNTAPDRMGSSVLKGEVPVVQKNVPPSRSVTWSGFAAVCGVCIVFVASKLIQSSIKVRLSRRSIHVHRPEMKKGEFNKGNLNVFRNRHEFPDGLVRRPLLDRKELMSNIKKAQDSRKWFIFSNLLFPIYDDTSIPEIRRIAKVPTSEEGILEKHGTKEKNVIPRPIDSTEEVSASYSRQFYLDEVSDISEPNGISLSQYKIEESIEQTVDLKNGAQIVNIGDEGNIEDVEMPEPTYCNERVTSTEDRNRNLVIYLSEKEAQIGSGNVHEFGPNSTCTLRSEFESKEQSVEVCEKNLDCIQGIEASMPFISEQQMIYAKDKAHDFSTNVVSEQSEGFSISSSELTKNETLWDNNVSVVNGIHEIEATRTSVNVNHTACCEEFSSYNTGIVDIEACKTPVMAETERSIEHPEDLRTEIVRAMQEQEPSISFGNDKQRSHGTENNHKERIVHDKTETRMETDHTGIFNNASTPSFLTSHEETGQHIFAKLSTSEKRQERKKPRAHSPKKKGKLQKQVYNDKEAETEQSEQGKPGTETVVDPTNQMQKTKKVPKKRQKKVQKEIQRVPGLGDVQCSSMVDQKNNGQHVKKARRKNPKNTFHNQGVQAREENLETTYVISSPDNATMDSMKPLGVADSSVKTHFSKDGFSEDQPNGYIKEELKLNL